MVPVWHQAILWTHDFIVYWHIYASLGLNELTLIGSTSLRKTTNSPSVKLYHICLFGGSSSILLNSHIFYSHICSKVVICKITAMVSSEIRYRNYVIVVHFPAIQNVRMKWWMNWLSWTETLDGTEKKNKKELILRPTWAEVKALQ